MIYQFINTKTSQIADVWIPITGDVRTYNGENGLETGVWKRHYDGQFGYGLSQDTKIDPYSQKDFSKATHKKMTIGEMWDLSKELSEKRESKDGIDKVKEKNMRDYEKRVGVKHHDELRREKQEMAKKNLEKLGFGIEH